MSGVSPHVRDEIDDLVSGRLDADTVRRIESHLNTCEPCRREWKAVHQTREALRQSTAEAALPPEIARRVNAALDREAAGAPLERARFRKWQWAAAAAAVVLIAFGVLLLLRPSPAREGPRRIDFAETVARDYAAIGSSTLPLQIRSDRPAAIETFFTRTGISFPTRVFDLGMMGYRLEGGRVHRLAGRPSALFVYRNAKGELLVCQMFEATVASLPPGAIIREHNGIRFYRYTRGKTTTVFWPERAVLCVLAGDMAPDEVLQLAYAKAVKV